MLDLSLSLALRTPLRAAAAPVISIASGTGYAGSLYRASIAGGQWHANGAAIAGATGQDWTMTIGNEGAAITYRLGGQDSNVIEMWVPQDAPGLVALMDIRRGLTLSGSNVAAWASQVGGVSATETTTAIQPGYSATAFGGSPGLVLDGAKALWNLAIARGPAARSCSGGFVLASTGVNRPLLAGHSDSGYYVLRVSAGGNLEVSSANVAIRATDMFVVTVAAPAVASSRFSASNYSFRCSGDETSAGVTGVLPPRCPLSLDL